MPFRMATFQDKNYKCFGLNREDAFWKQHAKSKPEGMDFISESLMDLLS